MPFTDRTLSFLFENKLMDSRDWFKEHKAEYEQHVLNPLAEIFTAITPTMLEIDPDFVCIPQAGKSISRIWRDTRFSKDMSIYRDHMWFSFIEEKHVGLPEFFFSVSPAGCHWGCGWYWTGTDTMRVIREKVLAKDPEWLAAEKAYKAQTAFTIEGERYKKSPYTARPDNERLWLDQRNIYLISPTDTEIMFSPDLPEKLKKDFTSIAPIYKFFLHSTVRRSYGRE